MKGSRALLAIAHESLALVHAGRAVADVSSYYLSGIHALVRTEGPTQSPTQFIQSGKGQCQVCACGLMLVSAAALFDELPPEADVPDLGSAEEAVYAYLEPIIGRHQRALIETAFMASTQSHNEDAYWHKGLSPEERNAAWAFGRQYTSHELRVIAIMENVIAHKGEFVPPQIVNPSINDD